MTKILSILEYSEKARATAIYKDKVIYSCLGLMGEASELYEKLEAYSHANMSSFQIDTDIKKIELLKKGIITELGDILWYINSLAFDLSIRIEDLFNGYKTFGEYEEYHSLFESADEWEDSILQIFYKMGCIQEIIKKSIRVYPREPLTEEKYWQVKECLINIVYDWCDICSFLDVTIEEVATVNIEKLESRKARNVIHGEGDNR